MKRQEDVKALRNRLVNVMRLNKDDNDEMEKKYFLGMVDALNWVLGEKEKGLSDFVAAPNTDFPY